MTDSKQTYIEKYDINYGTMYPEGHIIRLYEHLLKYEYGLSGEKGESVLDFGCGNGTHTEYLRTKGFETYGLDIVTSAIEQAKQRFPACKFAEMDLYQSPQTLFDKQFDLILCNQVLYYMGNEQLNRVTRQLYDCMNQDGLIYITMMATKNHYWEKAEAAEDGLSKVTLKGRLNETSHINFVHSENDLVERFSIFEPLYVGYYDSSSREGSTYHYQFLGKKK